MEGSHVSCWGLALFIPPYQAVWVLPELLLYPHGSVSGKEGSPFQPTRWRSCRRSSAWTSHIPSHTSCPSLSTTCLLLCELLPTLSSWDSGDRCD